MVVPFASPTGLAREIAPTGLLTQMLIDARCVTSTSLLRAGPDLINALGVGVECARPYAPS
jgi:hypothetical protein